MPGQFIDRPNPPALPSALPEETLDLAAKIESKPIGEDDLKSLNDFQRAACYIAGGQFIPSFSLISLWLTTDNTSDDIS